MLYTDLPLKKKKQKKKQNKKTNKKKQKKTGSGSVFVITTEHAWMC